MTYFEDVDALGPNMEIGYNSTPDGIEIVSVTVLNDPSNRDDQSSIIQWLTDDAIGVIHAALIAKIDRKGEDKRTERRIESRLDRMMERHSWPTWMQ